LREAYRKANGSELSETRFAAYPLTYSSAGFGGWFIPESGVYHDDESISYTYDGFDPTTAAPSTAVCLAHTLWEMLEEEIFISTRQESSSKYRKMFKRMNINDTGVSIITLRHANYIGERDEEGRVIDWQYQWITRGHYRRITDKHTGEQKLVWVRAHRKGPADKPLRLTTKINAMTR
jgi:hypothetical protein